LVADPVREKFSNRAEFQRDISVPISDLSAVYDESIQQPFKYKVQHTQEYGHGQTDGNNHYRVLDHLALGRPSNFRQLIPDLFQKLNYFLQNITRIYPFDRLGVMSLSKDKSHTNITNNIRMSAFVERYSRTLKPPQGPQIHH